MRQLEDESRAAARTLALRVQGAPELLSGQRAAVQTEAVARRARGEAMAEQPPHILRRDADAVVDDGDAGAPRACSRCAG